MSTINTQEQAVAELHRLSDMIGRLVTRYDNGGAAIRATTARQLAGAFREMAAVYDRVPQLYSGHKPGKWLALAAARDAAAMNDQRARDWSAVGDRDQLEADRIARASEAVFAELSDEAGHRVVRDHQRYRANLRSVK